MKKSSVQRLLAIAALAGSVGFLPACSPLDIDENDDDLLTALETRKKLDKAIPKVQSFMGNKERMEKFVPVLTDMYLKGSGFDREVITALAQSGSENARPAFEKAIESNDRRQITQAAYGIKKIKDAALFEKLLGKYDKFIDTEVKRVILDVGTEIKSEKAAQKAKDILDGDRKNTAYTLLRTSCNILEFQKYTAARDTLMVSLFYMDGVGRSLQTDCTRALLSLGKEAVEDTLISAYNLEIKELNDFIAENPDTLTSDTVRNNTANSLALLRSEKAVPYMLKNVGDTKVIPIPGTLVIKPSGDIAWTMWASLVGASSQSSFFALNDIGVRGNEEAKRIFTDIYNWTEPYKNKFSKAIKLSGTTNIEVSQRVNAFRVLRENGLINTEETLTMIEKLKGEEFQDERTYRNWARASIGTDMVTYIAVTAKAGELKAIWNVFNDMKNAEFAVPEVKEGEAKVQNANDDVSARIDAVRPAFELAERCDTNAPCYARELQNDKLSNYERIRGVYELGVSGQHDYFETVAGLYKTFDMFGQIYATNALANLGTKDDIPRVKELNKTLAKEMSQINYTSAKPNLEHLITILENK